MKRIPILALLLCALSPEAAPATAVEDLQDEVFYHFMPIAWRDSDVDTARFGDFDGMTASLDYLEDLGITAVWMNPVFPSPAYHGYQHGRADELNSWFGTEAQFTHFVEQAHARQIKVYVDFVVYGISQDTPWFADAYLNPSSVYDDWLAFTNPANSEYQGCCPYTSWNGNTVGFIHWDLRAVETRQLVTQWATKWLDPNEDGNLVDGLDGFRLDHVWQNYPSGPDGWGYNVDDFWVPFGSSLRATNPDFLLLAEQADWGTFGTQLFGGLDGAFTKPFEFAARDALANENAGALYWAAEATVNADQAATAEGTFLATIGNHDVNRLASVIGDSFDKGKAAAAVLLTQRYPPAIYFGDEIGMRGAKDTGLGGDASDIPMREPFKWTAVEGPPMSRYHILHPDAWNNRISRDNDGRSVEEQEGDPGSLLEAYRELIAVRKASVALRRGDYHEVPASDAAAWAFARIHDDQQTLVVINTSGAVRGLSLDLSEFGLPGGTTAVTSLLDGGAGIALSAANQASYPLVLDAYGYDILELSLSAPTPPVSRVDGLDFYGYRAGVQTTWVEEGLDNIFELDQLFVRRDDTHLDVALAGNMASGPGGVCVFYDLGPGGQNVLDMSGQQPPPNGPEQLSGLRFDAGFTPDGFFYANNYQETLYADHFHLLDGGGATRDYLGGAPVNAGHGLLSGGTNPNGIEVALANANSGGVTESEVGDAPNVFTGMEWSIPLVEMGYDGSQGSIKLAAFLLRSDGSVTNQWIPALGADIPEPGIAPDLTAYAGDQFFTVDLAGGPVGAPAVQTELELAVSRVGQMTRLSFSLPRSGHARLDVYNLRGRRVITLLNGPQASGPQRLSWDGQAGSGGPVAAGVYFARLKWEGRTATAKVLRID